MVTAVCLVGRSRVAEPVTATVSSLSVTMSEKLTWAGPASTRRKSRLIVAALLAMLFCVTSSVAKYSPALSPVMLIASLRAADISSRHTCVQCRVGAVVRDTHQWKLRAGRGCATSRCDCQPACGVARVVDNRSCKFDFSGHRCVAGKHGHAHLDPASDRVQPAGLGNHLAGQRALRGWRGLRQSILHRGSAQDFPIKQGVPM